MRELKSDNYNPGLQGWRISANGKAEFQDGVFRGKIVASEGVIGGWNIGTDKLYGSGILEGGTIRTATSGSRIELDSTNYLRAYDESGLRVKLNNSALVFFNNYSEPNRLVGTIYGGTNEFYISTPVDLETDLILFAYSKLKLTSYAGYIEPWCHIIPAHVGYENIGNATYYFNDVSAKSFTDRGCIIDIEEDEALQNLRNIKKPKKFLKSRQSEKLKTNPKYSRLDYDSFPDYVKDIPSEEEQKKGAEKGIDLSSAISMLIAVCKGLDNRLKKLEENYAKSK